MTNKNKTTISPVVNAKASRLYREMMVSAQNLTSLNRAALMACFTFKSDWESVPEGVKQLFANLVVKADL